MKRAQARDTGRGSSSDGYGSDVSFSRECDVELLAGATHRAVISICTLVVAISSHVHIVQTAKTNSSQNEM